MTIGAGMSGYDFEKKIVEENDLMEIRGKVSDLLFWQYDKTIFA